MIVLPQPAICLITNRRLLDPDARTERDEILALERFLAEAIDAGVDLIQLRERDLEAHTLGGLTERTVTRAAGTPVKVFVNDRVDVAISAGAHVHLRGDSPPTRRIREIVDPAILLGRSIHSTDETTDDADFFIFGTVFATPSKPGSPVAGIEGLAAAVRRAAVPVLAIGGLTPDRVFQCRAAGATGIAAIGMFLPAGRTRTSLGPAAAVTAIRTHWSRT